MTTSTAPHATGAFTIVESDELTAMAEAVGAVMKAESSPVRVAAIADGPDFYDEALWRVLSDELGVTGLLIPEKFGGHGLGWREARVVLSELGRGLACAPFLSSCVVAPSILLADASEAGERLLPRIADGSAIVAVALGDPALLARAPFPVVKAYPSGAGWVLSGQLSFVADGPAADHFLVPAARPDGACAWFVVAADTPGVNVSAMTVIDTTRPQARVELVDATAAAAGEFRSADDILGPALDAAITGLACEQSAASQFLLELTVAYTKSRYQFGQPIGSFQAIQHRLADLAIKVDTSVSAVEYAIWAAAEEPDRWREASSMAGFVCAETMSAAAAETIQLHGGIGFTWEHVAHRYYRRALASRSQFGQPAQHRERLLQALSV